jgi:hypothetical protein
MLRRPHFLLISGLILVGAVGSANSPKTDRKPRAAVTFAKSIAPIIFEHCSGCHHPGEAAPFSLLTYADVAKRAALIADVTQRRIMPPWKAGKADFKLGGDFSLSDSELAAIKDWVKAGKPEGSPADLPPAPKFSNGWKLGQPDIVAKMPKPYAVPADGPDIYRIFTVPLHLDHDVWIKAVDFRPSNRTVVHHCLLFYDTTGKARELDAHPGKPGFAGSFPIGVTDQRSLSTFMNSGSPLHRPTFGGLGVWAVGDDPVPMQDGFAYFLPKGADLIFSTHFHPSGKAESEQSSVGLYLTNEPPRQGYAGVLLPPMWGEESGLVIPAGSKATTLEDSFTLPVNASLLSIWAHAHYLGKTFELTAILPDGTVKKGFNIPDWDFNWQASYNFEPIVQLPAGTKLISKITYDNSATNPRNPSNPPHKVIWGEQTVDEMGGLMLRLTAANDADLKTLQAAYFKHWMEVVQAAMKRGQLQSQGRASGGD